MLPVVYNDLNLFLCPNLVNCINVILFAPNSPSISVMFLCCKVARQSEIRAKTLKPNKTFFSYGNQIVKAMTIYSGGILIQFKIQLEAKGLKLPYVHLVLGCGKFDPNRISPSFETKHNSL